MTTKDTGGSAFPSFSAISHCDEGGMDLRDYFAAKAMQGMLANPYYAAQIANSETSGDIGKAAYFHADSMLAARNPEPQS